MILENILIGLNNAVSLASLIAIVIGTSLGLFVGAMPGLSATMAIALLLPITFGMDPATGISMLASLYMGAMYGGSIAAILIKTPGTPAAAATVMDGYPLNEQGKAGKAFGISLFASLIGGVLSSIALMTIAPLLGNLALQFGPVELFAVAVLGITIIGSLSQGSTLLGLLSGAIGLLLALVGMDPITGTPRFTFGSIYLFSGIPYTVALIGLFSIPQAIRLIERDEKVKKAINSFTDKMLPTLDELKLIIPNTIRSSIIGIVTGIIPGTGGDTACWFAYNEAKRFSKNKDKFGKGSIEGLSAAESANNAVVGGALIPTLTLGIPGSSATAIIMGGLMVHGIMPGPTLMTEHAGITYTLIWALLFSSIAMFGLGLIFTRLAINVTKISNKILAPVIIILCVIGSFAINNSIFDVYLMFAFGILGYFMNKINMPTAPMVVGMILGQMLDTSLHQSLLIGQGSWMVFIKNPISAVLLAIALISVLQSTPLFSFIKKKIKSNKKEAVN
ncbi:tripartite tricarboxylate transporter permease [Schnuerera ultunensis]|uniref:tripartite tricarboxylate transporter permease n=1 Tax=Schnuerera ultunensis TaxID=45497 RepID=UPI000419317A|nr:tripartite tricarboxylate transporter permease [Schnuerera ultunensis]